MFNPGHKGVVHDFRVFFIHSEDGIDVVFRVDEGGFLDGVYGGDSFGNHVLAECVSHRVWNFFQNKKLDRTSAGSIPSDDRFFLYFKYTFLFTKERADIIAFIAFAPKFVCSVDKGENALQVVNLLVLDHRFEFIVNSSDVCFYEHFYEGLFHFRTCRAVQIAENMDDDDEEVSWKIGDDKSAAADKCG